MEQVAVRCGCRVTSRPPNHGIIRGLHVWQDDFKHIIATLQPASALGFNLVPVRTIAPFQVRVFLDQRGLHLKDFHSKLALKSLLRDTRLLITRSDKELPALPVHVVKNALVVSLSLSVHLFQPSYHFLPLGFGFLEQIGCLSKISSSMMIHQLLQTSFTKLWTHSGRYPRFCISSLDFGLDVLVHHLVSFENQTPNCQCDENE
mmetsp:Transcript_30770/g.45582  ORF Transcript_30770/g.45582 Transcript_30770/m.45582 type:complete len:204 (+) Transcript_30770:1526-2137(+)